MARTFRFSNAASGLSLGGAFTHSLLDSASGTDAITATNSGGTSSGFFATDVGIPGTDGATGNYTIVLNVSTAAASTTAAVRIHRVNSGGTIQNSSSFTAEQSTATTGDKTFSFTSQSLGTWVSGDRFVVEVRVTNNNAHGGAAGPTFDHTAVNARADTPFTQTAINSGDGAAAGVGAATAVGTGLAVSNGASSGVGAATAVGSSTAASVGSSAGVGAASGARPPLTIRLLQSTTIVAERFPSLTASEQTFAFALTAGERAAITNWSQLRVELLANGQQVRATWLELETPAAAAGNVGSAAGTSTAIAVGASTAASAGASTGVAAVTGIGASTAASIGTASGLGDATATGASTAEAVGTSSGVSTADAFSSAESAGSATGTSTATAVGASTAAAIGTASGVGAATAVGTSTTETVGSSAGTSSVSAVAIVTAAVAGSAAGTSTVDAQGASTAASVGSASGIADATAVGTSTAASAATASGTSDASAVGASTAQSAAVATGIAAATGIGQTAYSGQRVGPSADLSVGTWTASTGTDRFAMIDEVDPNDSDYIRSSASPVDDTVVFDLSDLQQPQDGDVVILVRHKLAA